MRRRVHCCRLLRTIVVDGTIPENHLALGWADGNIIDIHRGSAAKTSTSRFSTRPSKVNLRPLWENDKRVFTNNVKGGEPSAWWKDWELGVPLQPSRWMTDHVSDSAAIKGYSHQVIHESKTCPIVRQLPGLCAQDFSTWDRSMVLVVAVGHVSKGSNLSVHWIIGDVNRFAVLIWEELYLGWKSIATWKSWPTFFKFFLCILDKALKNWL